MAQGTLTANNCFKDQGADRTDGCRSLKYKLCDKLTLDPYGTCNIFTKGDVQVQVQSVSVDTLIWYFVNNSDGECKTLKMMAPDIYAPFSKLKTGNGICGYKF